jgi:hypothetical protein
VKYRNKKNGNIYIRDKNVINATNSNDGQVMVLYRKEEDYDNWYVREISEFYEKFEKV